MTDIAVILVIVLIAVIIWRGPKTLPLLGRAFGQGVKGAREEIDGMKSDIAAAKDAGAGTPTDKDETKPA
jgi:Sec-independent protein translocase protein TatA